MSISLEPDHVFLHLVESAAFNKGKAKQYRGIAGNLFAYACKVSFENKFGGYVAFAAKTALIGHYRKTLGAHQIGNSLKMYIETPEATKLVNQYFPKT